MMDCVWQDGERRTGTYFVKWSDGRCVRRGVDSEMMRTQGEDERAKGQ